MKPYLFSLLLASIAWVAGANAADTRVANTDPVKLETYTVSEAPFGYLGIKHASVVLSPWRLLTFRGGVKYLQIDELYPDSPGLSAGIMPGDRIIGLNGVPIKRWSFRRLKAFGETVEVGRNVILEILRPPETTSRQVAVTIVKRTGPAVKR
jgi:S1-C subfamily serine protease